MNARFASVALAVTRRNLRHAFTNPALLLPSVMFPLVFLIAFAGGLSRVSGVPGFDVSSWVGIFAPAKTPQPVVDKLQRELLAALRTPFVRERYATLGIEPVGNAPREFFEQVREDLIRWEKVVKAANVRVE